MTKQKKASSEVLFGIREALFNLERTFRIQDIEPKIEIRLSRRNWQGLRYLITDDQSVYYTDDNRGLLQNELRYFNTKFILDDTL